MIYTLNFAFDILLRDINILNQTYLTVPTLLQLPMRNLICSCSPSYSQQFSLLAQFKSIHIFLVHFSVDSVFAAVCYNWKVHGLENMYFCCQCEVFMPQYLVSIC